MAEPNGSDDDRYVLDDEGASIEDIEHEMQKAAEEAAADPPANAPQAQAEPGVAEWRDRYLRTLADFDNYRKRADREKQDFFKYALAGTLRDLLPVLDNFERAVDHAEEGDEFHRGVALIYKQLFDVLTKHGVRVID